MGVDTSSITEEQLRPVMRWIEVECEARGIRDFWSRIDEEMVRRFMVQGLGYDQILRQFWDIPQPQPLDAKRLSVLAVYVGNGSEKGTKVRIKDSLETILSCDRGDRLEVELEDGRALKNGIVTKGELLAFEICYETPYEEA